jgi:polyhydroxyalkanoate synthesis regulator phasin
MFKNRFSRIGLITAGAIAVAAATVAVSASAAGLNVVPFAASSPSPSPGQAQAKAQAYCNSFVDHLAGSLGKSSQDVRSAMQKAAGQTVDDAVKKGDLTQQQGDALKQKLASGQACSGVLPHLGRGPGHPGAFGPSRDAIVDAAAKSLGISSDELKKDLANGMTLHQVADSKHVSEQQFRDSFIQNITPALDQAVKDGKLTKDQENKALERFKSSPIPFWDHPARKGPRAGSPSPSA